MYYGESGLTAADIHSFAGTSKILNYKFILLQSKINSFVSGARSFNLTLKNVAHSPGTNVSDFLLLTPGFNPQF